MSNSPTPPNKILDTLRSFLNLITHDRLSNFVQILPYLTGLLVFLAPLALLTQQWSSETFAYDISPKLKTKICENYKDKVREKLDMEGKKNITIDKAIPVKDNGNRKQQLPFHCQYHIIGDDQNLSLETIAVEIKHVFPELANNINSQYETEVDWEDVCNDATIIQQMKSQAKANELYDESKGYRIVSIGPELDQQKTDVYPVFRWVCKYQIKRRINNGNFQIVSDGYRIDVALEDYCKSKAEQLGNKNTKPTHHNYKDPYSLYCVNPHAPRRP